MYPVADKPSYIPSHNNIDAFNIILTAYGFIINLYPVYDKLEVDKRNEKNILSAVLVAMLFSALMYIMFAQFAKFNFGEEVLKPNVFQNFDSGFVSIILKLLFLLIFLCALPFNIHPVRNCLMTFLQELMTGEVS